MGYTEHSLFPREPRVGRSLFSRGITGAEKGATEAGAGLSA